MAIGTTAAILGGAAIAGGATIAAGSAGAGAARDAAQTQSQAATQNQQALLQAGQVAAEGLAPWEEIGLDAYNQYASLLGLEVDGEALSSDEVTGRLQADTGYQFARQEGMRGIEQSAAASGSLRSGQTLAALSEYNQGLASNQYQNYLGRLAGLVDTGYNAAVAGANVQVGTAGQAAQANTQAAQAVAQGQLQSGQAWSNAIGGVGSAIGTGLGYLSQPSYTSSSPSAGLLPSVGSFPSLNTSGSNLTLSAGNPWS